MLLKHIEREGVEELEVTILSAPGDVEAAALAAALLAKCGCLIAYETATGTRKRRVPLPLISWIEAQEEGTLLHLADGGTLFGAARLSALEAELGQDVFVRASRQALVNLDQVLTIRPEFGSRLVLGLAGGGEVLVTRSHVPTVKQRIGIGGKGD